MNVFLQTSLVLTLFLFSAVECGIGDAAESISGGNYELPKASAELFQQQKDRIDFLEASLKAVAFALTKQNNKVFASVVGELKKDPYVSSLLSSATDYKPTSSKNRVEVTTGDNLEVLYFCIHRLVIIFSLLNMTGHQNYTNAAVSKVKWALKCSQPELFDIKSNGKLRSFR